MALPILGKLSKVTNLRDYWGNEAMHFTPWLARPENLKLLAEALGIGELQLLQVEGSAGKFRADIVAQSGDNDCIAVIENQLERTDHDHLGKLMTYSSVRDAQIVIWIARSFNEEHRSVFDWFNRMNQNAERPVRFFGVEIMLERIDNSRPAPRFNVVVQPNEYANGIGSAETPDEASETKSLQYEYWSGFNDFVEAHRASFNTQKPKAQYWYDISNGRTGFVVRLTVNTKDNTVGCELFIRNDKAAFAAFKKDRAAIEAALKAPLEWQRLNHKRGSRVRQTRMADLTEKDSWPHLFAWMKDRVTAFRQVFYPRITMDITTYADARSQKLRVQHERAFKWANGASGSRIG